MAASRRTRILIVDDSEFVRSYHSYILEQAQFQVITAVDGSDGLEKLYANPRDLVLTEARQAEVNVGLQIGQEPCQELLVPCARDPVESQAQKACLLRRNV